MITRGPHLRNIFKPGQLDREIDRLCEWGDKIRDECRTLPRNSAEYWDAFDRSQRFYDRATALMP